MVNTDGANFTGGPMTGQTCPACGYCPHCGRSAAPVAPYVPAPVYPMPVYPTYPWQQPWSPFAPQPWATITVTATGNTTGCVAQPMNQTLFGNWQFST